MISLSCSHPCTPTGKTPPAPSTRVQALTFAQAVQLIEAPGVGQRFLSTGAPAGQSPHRSQAQRVPHFSPEDEEGPG